MVDPNESLENAAKREVLEETGVHAEMIGLLGVKEALNYSFEWSDLYFVALMRATTEELKPEHDEGIKEAWWVSYDELEIKGENSGMILWTFAPGFGAGQDIIKKEMTKKIFENPMEFLELSSFTPKTYDFMGKTHTLYVNSFMKQVGESKQNQKL